MDCTRGDQEVSRQGLLAVAAILPSTVNICAKTCKEMQLLTDLAWMRRILGTLLHVLVQHKAPRLI